MKRANYRLITKVTPEGNITYFIEQKLKSFFGLISTWDLLEMNINFKSELEAERFLKQLEVKRSAFDSKSTRHIKYYQVETDTYFKG